MTSHKIYRPFWNFPSEQLFPAHDSSMRIAFAVFLAQKFSKNFGIKCCIRKLQVMLIFFTVEFVVFIRTFVLFTVIFVLFK